MLSSFCFVVLFFDCGWSLLNHGVADTKRLNLGNLNPIYERELTKLELHQGEGRWIVSKNGARGEEVGISNRRGARCKSPGSRTRGVREVSATCNSHSVAEADGSLVLPKQVLAQGFEMKKPPKRFVLR